MIPPDQPPPIVYKYPNEKMVKPSPLISSPKENTPVFPSPIRGAFLNGKTIFNMPSRRKIENNVINQKKRESYPGPSGDDDIFEQRITDQDERWKIVRDLKLAHKNIFGFFSNSRQKSEFEDYIKNLLDYISTIVTDPRNHTDIIKEILLITPTLTFSEVLGKIYTKRLKKWVAETENQYGESFISRFEQIQNYLRKVSKARLVEIAINTQISEKDVERVLIIGPFTHHKTCYWRFADEVILKKNEGEVIIKKNGYPVAYILLNNQYYGPNILERYYDLKDKFGKYPLVRGNSITEKVWQEWEPKIIEIIQPDLKQDWELDRNFWGSSCLIYDHKRIFIIKFIELKGVTVRFKKRQTVVKEPKKGLFRRIIDKLNQIIR